jgi:hypothetical protein
MWLGKVTISGDLTSSKYDAFCFRLMLHNPLLGHLEQCIPTRILSIRSQRDPVPGVHKHPAFYQNPGSFPGAKGWRCTASPKAQDIANTPSSATLDHPIGLGGWVTSGSTI